MKPYDISEKKREEQLRVLEELANCRGQHALMPHDDGHIRAFVRRDEGEDQREAALNVWPTKDIHPYEITRITPLPSEAYFDAWALLGIKDGVQIDD